MIGFYAAGAMGRGGGGGAGQPPDTYPGLTFWYDGDNSPQWKGSSTTAGAATVNGDNMQRADSVPPSIARCFAGAPGTFLAPAHGAHNGFRKTSTAPNTFYERPVGAATPSVSLSASTLFTDSAKTIIAAVRINSANTSGGANPYSNAAIVSDQSLYLGLYFYRSGASDIVFQAYSYGGKNDVAAATVTGGLGQWVVVTYKHGGGNILIRINGAQIGSPVAAGNTSVMTGLMRMGSNNNGNDMIQLALYNTAVADADILEVERYFGGKCGVVIP